MRGTVKAVSVTTSGLAGVVFDELPDVYLIESGYGIRQLLLATDGEPIGKTIEFHTAEYADKLITVLEVVG